MPHIRSALVIAKQAMEERKTGCKDMKETEHKDKTLQDTELIWSIGKAIGKTYNQQTYEHRTFLGDPPGPQRAEFFS